MFLVVPALGVVSTTWRSILRVLGADESQIPGPADPAAAGDADQTPADTETTEGAGTTEPAGAN
jgi:hypothetical protein